MNFLKNFTTKKFAQKIIGLSMAAITAFGTLAVYAAPTIFHTEDNKCTVEIKKSTHGNYIVIYKIEGKTIFKYSDNKIKEMTIFDVIDYYNKKIKIEESREENCFIFDEIKYIFNDDHISDKKIIAFHKAMIAKNSMLTKLGDVEDEESGLKNTDNDKDYESDPDTADNYDLLKTYYEDRKPYTKEEDYRISFNCYEDTDYYESDSDTDKL